MNISLTSRILDLEDDSRDIKQELKESKGDRETNNAILTLIKMQVDSLIILGRFLLGTMVVGVIADLVMRLIK